MSTFLTAVILGTLTFLAATAVTGVRLAATRGRHARLRAPLAPRRRPDGPAPVPPVPGAGPLIPVPDMTVTVRRPQFATCPQAAISGGRPYARLRDTPADGYGLVIGGPLGCREVTR